MKVIATDIDGVVIIEPHVFNDERGYFYESFSDKEFRSKVCKTTFVQDNQSKSTYGVLRGLHFQQPPYAQAKLVRVTKGRALDIAVDIRLGSPTYGKHIAIELSEDNHRQLFLSRGFAHGFVALSEEVVFQYKCDNFYNKESEGTLRWNDPEIGIDWKISEADIISSEKDKNSLTLKDFISPFKYE